MSSSSGYVMYDDEYNGDHESNAHAKVFYSAIAVRNTDHLRACSTLTLRAVSGSSTGSR